MVDGAINVASLLNYPLQCTENKRRKGSTSPNQCNEETKVKDALSRYIYFKN